MSCLHCNSVIKEKYKRDETAKKLVLKTAQEFLDDQPFVWHVFFGAGARDIGLFNDNGRFNEVSHLLCFCLSVRNVLV